GQRERARPRARARGRERARRPQPVRRRPAAGAGSIALGRAHADRDARREPLSPDRQPSVLHQPRPLRLLLVPPPAAPRRPTALWPRKRVVAVWPRDAIGGRRGPRERWRRGPR